MASPSSTLVYSDSLNITSDQIQSVDHALHVYQSGCKLIVTNVESRKSVMVPLESGFQQDCYCVCAEERQLVVSVSGYLHTQLRFYNLDMTALSTTQSFTPLSSIPFDALVDVSNQSASTQWNSSVVVDMSRKKQPAPGKTSQQFKSNEFASFIYTHSSIIHTLIHKSPYALQEICVSPCRTLLQCRDRSSLYVYPLLLPAECVNKSNINSDYYAYPILSSVKSNSTLLNSPSIISIAKNLAPLPSFSVIQPFEVSLFHTSRSLLSKEQAKSITSMSIHPGSSMHKTVLPLCALGQGILQVALHHKEGQCVLEVDLTSMLKASLGVSEDDQMQPGAPQFQSFHPTTGWSVQMYTQTSKFGVSSKHGSIHNSNVNPTMTDDLENSDANHNNSNGGGVGLVSTQVPTKNTTSKNDTIEIIATYLNISILRGVLAHAYNEQVLFPALDVLVPGILGKPHNVLLINDSGDMPLSLVKAMYVQREAYVWQSPMSPVRVTDKDITNSKTIDIEPLMQQQITSCNYISSKNGVVLVLTSGPSMHILVTDFVHAEMNERYVNVIKQKTSTSGKANQKPARVPLSVLPIEDTNMTHAQDLLCETTEAAEKLLDKCSGYFVITCPVLLNIPYVFAASGSSSKLSGVASTPCNGEEGFYLALSNDEAWLTSVEGIIMWTATQLEYIRKKCKVVLSHYVEAHAADQVAHVPTSSNVSKSSMPAIKFDPTLNNTSTNEQDTHPFALQSQVKLPILNGQLLPCSALRLLPAYNSVILVHSDHTVRKVEYHGQIPSIHEILTKHMELQTDQRIQAFALGLSSFSVLLALGSIQDRKEVQAYQASHPYDIMSLPEVEPVHLQNSIPTLQDRVLQKYSEKMKQWDSPALHATDMNEGYHFTLIDATTSSTVHMLTLPKVFYCGSIKVVDCPTGACTSACGKQIYVAMASGRVLVLTVLETRLVQIQVIQAFVPSPRGAGDCVDTYCNLYGHFQKHSLRGEESSCLVNSQLGVCQAPTVNQVLHASDQPQLPAVITKLSVSPCGTYLAQLHSGKSSIALYTMQRKPHPQLVLYAIIPTQTHTMSMDWVLFHTITDTFPKPHLMLADTIGRCLCVTLPSPLIPAQLSDLTHLAPHDLLPAVQNYVIPSANIKFHSFSLPHAITSFASNPHSQPYILSFFATSVDGYVHKYVQDEDLTLNKPGLRASVPLLIGGAYTSRYNLTYTYPNVSSLVKPLDNISMVKKLLDARGEKSSAPCVLTNDAHSGECTCLNMLAYCKPFVDAVYPLHPVDVREELAQVLKGALPLALSISPNGMALTVVDLDGSVTLLSSKDLSRREVLVGKNDSRNNTALVQSLMGTLYRPNTCSGYGVLSPETRQSSHPFNCANLLTILTPSWHIHSQFVYVTCASGVLKIDASRFFQAHDHANKAVNVGNHLNSMFIPCTQFPVYQALLSEHEDGLIHQALTAVFAVTNYSMVETPIHSMDIYNIDKVTLNSLKDTFAATRLQQNLAIFFPGAPCYLRKFFADELGALHESLTASLVAMKRKVTTLRETNTLLPEHSRLTPEELCVDVNYCTNVKTELALKRETLHRTSARKRYTHYLLAWRVLNKYYLGQHFGMLYASRVVLAGKHGDRLTAKYANLAEAYLNHTSVSALHRTEHPMVRALALKSTQPELVVCEEILQEQPEDPLTKLTNANRVVTQLRPARIPARPSYEKQGTWGALLPPVDFDPEKAVKLALHTLPVQKDLVVSDLCDTVRIPVRIDPAQSPPAHLKRQKNIPVKLSRGVITKKAGFLAKIAACERSWYQSQDPPVYTAKHVFDKEPTVLDVDTITSIRFDIEHMVYEVLQDHPTLTHPRLDVASVLSALSNGTVETRAKADENGTKEVRSNAYSASITRSYTNLTFKQEMEKAEEELLLPTVSPDADKDFAGKGDSLLNTVLAEVHAQARVLEAPLKHNIHWEVLGGHLTSLYPCAPRLSRYSVCLQKILNKFRSKVFALQTNMELYALSHTKNECRSWLLETTATASCLLTKATVLIISSTLGQTSALEHKIQSSGGQPVDIKSAGTRPTRVTLSASLVVHGAAQTVDAATTDHNSTEDGLTASELAWMNFSATLCRCGAVACMCEPVNIRLGHFAASILQLYRLHALYPVHLLDFVGLSERKTEDQQVQHEELKHGIETMMLYSPVGIYKTSLSAPAAAQDTAFKNYLPARGVKSDAASLALVFANVECNAFGGLILYSTLSMLGKQLAAAKIPMSVLTTLSNPLLMRNDRYHSSSEADYLLTLEKANALVSICQTAWMSLSRVIHMANVDVGAFLVEFAAANPIYSEKQDQSITLMSYLKGEISSVPFIVTPTPEMDPIVTAHVANGIESETSVFLRTSEETLSSLWYKNCHITQAFDTLLQTLAKNIPVTAYNVHIQDVMTLTGVQDCRDSLLFQDKYSRAQEMYEKMSREANMLSFQQKGLQAVVQSAEQAYEVEKLVYSMVNKAVIAENKWIGQVLMDQYNGAGTSLKMEQSTKAKAGCCVAFGGSQLLIPASFKGPDVQSPVNSKHQASPSNANSANVDIVHTHSDGPHTLYKTVCESVHVVNTPSKDIEQMVSVYGLFTNCLEGPVTVDNILNNLISATRRSDTVPSIPILLNNEYYFLPVKANSVPSKSVLHTVVETLEAHYKIWHHLHEATNRVHHAAAADKNPVPTLTSYASNYPSIAPFLPFSSRTKHKPKQQQYDVAAPVVPETSLGHQVLAAFHLSPSSTAPVQKTDDLLLTPLFHLRNKSLTSLEAWSVYQYNNKKTLSSVNVTGATVIPSLLSNYLLSRHNLTELFPDTCFNFRRVCINTQALLHKHNEQYLKCTKVTDKISQFSTTLSVKTCKCAAEQCKCKAMALLERDYINMMHQIPMKRVQDERLHHGLSHCSTSIQPSAATITSCMQLLQKQCSSFTYDMLSKHMRGQPTVQHIPVLMIHELNKVLLKQVKTYLKLLEKMHIEKSTAQQTFQSMRDVDEMILKTKKTTQTLLLVRVTKSLQSAIHDNGQLVRKDVMNDEMFDKKKLAVEKRSEQQEQKLANTVEEQQERTARVIRENKRLITLFAECTQKTKTSLQFVSGKKGPDMILSHSGVTEQERRVRRVSQLQSVYAQQTQEISNMQQILAKERTKRGSQLAQDALHISTQYRGMAENKSELLLLPFDPPSSEPGVPHYITSSNMTTPRKNATKVLPALLVTPTKDVSTLHLTNHNSSHPTVYKTPSKVTPQKQRILMKSSSHLPLHPPNSILPPLELSGRSMTMQPSLSAPALPNTKPK